ncbi:MAG: hypothetical protein KatS3mg031_1422 [Chitinophagales bacterium]|nr:MAG: hypothetical protein KatS3mg031_1422 [Chitinophagales bacterium]
MKSAVSIFLLAIINWQICLKGGIIGYYVLNQNYIATTLCENRLKPELHCNGKCYLKKQLKKSDAAEENNRQLPLSLKNMHDLQPFIEPTPIRFSLFSVSEVMFKAFAFAKELSYTPNIFHPPA